MSKADKYEKLWQADPRQVLRVGRDFQLAAVKRDATPGFVGTKKDAKKLLKRRGKLLSELQERLYAEHQRSLLIVLQGLDTAGKGGIVRHVIAMVDPQGVSLAAFKKPTAEEAAHDFLWRIRKRLPRPGYIGVFDRSHYEDILVPSVNGSLNQERLDERYAIIRDFEEELAENDTTVIKLALMVSYQEQGLRLRERVDRFDKHWKFSPHDLDVREQWDTYQRVYEQMLRRSSVEAAPWYLLPADNKWYARLAATEIITRTLAQLNPQWPPADFDPVAQRARIDETLRPQALAKYDSELQEKLHEITRAETEIAGRIDRLD